MDNIDPVVAGQRFGENSHRDFRPSDSTFSRLVVNAYSHPELLHLPEVNCLYSLLQCEINSIDHIVQPEVLFNGASAVAAKLFKELRALKESYHLLCASFGILRLKDQGVFLVPQNLGASAGVCSHDCETG